MRLSGIKRAGHANVLSVSKCGRREIKSARYPLRNHPYSWSKKLSERKQLPGFEARYKAVSIRTPIINHPQVNRDPASLTSKSDDEKKTNPSIQQLSLEELQAIQAVRIKQDRQRQLPPVERLTALWTKREASAPKSGRLSISKCQRAKKTIRTSQIGKQHSRPVRELPWSPRPKAEQPINSRYRRKKRKPVRECFPL